MKIYKLLISILILFTSVIGICAEEGPSYNVTFNQSESGDLIFKFGENEDSLRLFNVFKTPVKEDYEKDYDTYNKIEFAYDFKYETSPAVFTLINWERERLEYELYGVVVDEESRTITFAVDENKNILPKMDCDISFKVDGEEVLVLKNQSITKGLKLFPEIVNPTAVQDPETGDITITIPTEDNEFLKEIEGFNFEGNSLFTTIYEIESKSDNVFTIPYEALFLSDIYNGEYLITPCTEGYVYYNGNVDSSKMPVLEVVKSFEDGEKNINYELNLYPIKGLEITFKEDNNFAEDLLAFQSGDYSKWMWIELKSEDVTAQYNGYWMIGNTDSNSIFFDKMFYDDSYKLIFHSYYGSFTSTIEAGGLQDECSYYDEEFNVTDDSEIIEKLKAQNLVSISTDEPITLDIYDDFVISISSETKLLFQLSADVKNIISNKLNKTAKDTMVIESKTYLDATNNNGDGDRAEIEYKFPSKKVKCVIELTKEIVDYYEFNKDNTDLKVLRIHSLDDVDVIDSKLTPVYVDGVLVSYELSFVSDKYSVFVPYTVDRPSPEPAKPSYAPPRTDVK